MCINAKRCEKMDSDVQESSGKSAKVEVLCSETL